jgi:hypothetical protein
MGLIIHRLTLAYFKDGQLTRRRESQHPAGRTKLVEKHAIADRVQQFVRHPTGTKSCRIKM